MSWAKAVSAGYRRGARLLVLAGAALATAEVLCAQVYSVRDLGLFSDLPGRDDSKPYAINSSGQVAAGNVTNGAYRALLYGGAWTNLGTLGGSESLAYGINDSSRVVGSSTNASGALRAFLWVPGGTGGVPGNAQMQALGTLGGTSSAAYDINASGTIAGYAQTSANDHAFRYSGGTMTDIGALLPGGLPNSYGFSLNDAGRMAGTGYNNNWNSFHAFFYNGTNAIDLGTFGGQNSSALAINNNDHVVGYYTTSAGYDHAFRYVAGAMIDLGTLGGHWSYASGINNSNVIVGGSYVDATDTNYHAFLWATNTMIDLNTRLDPSGAGWTLVEARAINDAGQIVGLGLLSGGNRSFLLTPVPWPQITQQPTNLAIPCPGNATFAVTATPGGAFFRWYRGSPPGGSPIANATNSTLVLSNLTGADTGNYYVTAANAAGSVTSSVATLTVIDTSPPVLSGCPQDLAANTTSNLCAALVFWTGPTANDNCDGVVPVVCTPPSGSTFNKGVTVVICRANDSSQNTNSCSFTVTVWDAQAPFISNVTATNSTANVLNCASPIPSPASVEITVQAGDNCGALAAAPTLLLTNGASTASLDCDCTNGASFHYVWILTTNTPSGTWDAVAMATDGANTNAAQFTLCVVPSICAVSGLVELDRFVGASREVVFVATAGLAGTNRLQTNVLTLVFTNGGAASYAPYSLAVPWTTVGISAKTAWNLRTKLYPVFSGGAAVLNFTGAAMLRAGDLNGDNGVDASDMALLFDHWYTPDPTGDLDGDGEVNAIDMGMLFDHWYTSGDDE